MSLSNFLSVLFLLFLSDSLVTFLIVFETLSSHIHLIEVCFFSQEFRVHKKKVICIITISFLDVRDGTKKTTQIMANKPLYDSITNKQSSKMLSHCSSSSINVMMMLY